ncbi:MAG: hypothetical protein U9R50_05320 [Campylobacterota bacterium]|nr:hypothetical protein [Campylobacterota bacterium]
MRLFYYVHTGHRIGLDRFRRAAAIINALGDSVDITLLCSDFRIAHEARAYGIKNAVGIDVVRNIPQIAHHGDKIIFDSTEYNPIMLEDMCNFFSTFIRISDDPHEHKHPKEFLISPYLEGEKICKATVVGSQYFKSHAKNIEKVLFFGDDDYEKDLEKNLDMFRPYQMDLGLGFYFFIDYEEDIASAFNLKYDFEDYEEMIQASKILLSASPQAILESLASGGRPIYLQRPDYSREYLELFESLNIPIIDGFDKERLSQLLDDNLSHKYNVLQNDTPKLLSFLKQSLNL